MDSEEKTTSFIEILGSLLLFGLVFGMSATVDIHALQAQLHNSKALMTGLFLQFGCMPFLGFLVVRILRLRYEVGIVLLVLTSSPGGSYSNWFCSLFNADLALSVAMTTISTVISVAMLPLNLYIYARWAYNNDVSDILQWDAIALALSMVLMAIFSGLLASYHFGTPAFHVQCNRVGNVAGLLLVIFSSIMSNTTKGSRLWDHDWIFYGGVAFPCLAGLLIASLVTTLVGLPKPERVTIAVECCIQNCGISVSVALTMFDGSALAQALSVPFYYGIVECFVITLYCLLSWKQGWTKAPEDVSLWNMISTSYEVLVQVQQQQQQQEEAAANGCFYAAGSDDDDEQLRGNDVDTDGAVGGYQKYHSFKTNLQS